MEGQLTGCVKNGKGLGSTNWQLQSSPRDVKYSTGNTLTNVVINMHGARWVIDLLEGQLHKLHKNV